MGLILELLLLFVVIFFAVRFAVTGHAENRKVVEPTQEEILLDANAPIS